jgi:chemotaxis protein methyltransferase CheR
LLPAVTCFWGTPRHFSSRFERQSHAGSFYYRENKDRGMPLRREQASPPLPITVLKPAKSPAPPIPPAAPVPPVPQEQPPARITLKSELDLEEVYKKAETLFEAEEFQKASILLEGIISKKPDHTGALVVQGFIMANNGRFPEALTLCNKALGINDLLPEAYFLRGLLLDMNDSLAEAVKEYRKTILLRMDFVMAHYHLGRLYCRLGKKTEGARELRNTLKILEKARLGSVIPFSGGLSREVFLQQMQGELAEVA